MKHPITLAQALAEGRDPLHILGADRALLLDTSWLARVEAGAPLMFWGEDDDEEEDDVPESTPYELTNGVAVLDIEGPLAQRGWFCVEGYDTVAGALTKALADTRVASVLLRLNSPGGAAAGAFEWCGQMRERVVVSGKRVVAYADEMALSGAYAVACVADEIVVPETGEVGSVGVIASIVSRVAKNKMDGRDVRVVSAGAEKADGHPDLPLDDAAIARFQADVNALAGVFYRWVGDRRRMSVNEVAALEAGTRMGGNAVAARLADRVLGYHALLAEMQRASTPVTPAPTTGARSPAATSARTPRKNTMDNEALAAEIAAITGESDAAVQVGVLRAKAQRAAQADALETELRELKTAQQKARHAALIQQAEDDGKLDADLRVWAETAAPDALEGYLRVAKPTAKTALIESLETSGKLTPGLREWAQSLPVRALQEYAAKAPALIPQTEHQPPAEAPDTGLPPDVAAAVAKARKDGWKALSAGEKHAITSHSKPLADRLRGESR